MTNKKVYPRNVFYVNGFLTANARKICKFFFGDFYVGLKEDVPNRQYYIKVKKQLRAENGVPINIPLKFAYDSIDKSIEKNKDNEIIKVCLTQLKQDFIRKYGEESMKKDVLLQEFLDVDYFKEFFGPQWNLVYETKEKFEKV